MSTDLREQIRQFASQVEAGQPPVTLDEIRLRIDLGHETEPLIGHLAPSRSLPMRRRRWVAVLAAVAVIVLFGALALMLPGDEPAPPADTVPQLPEGASFEYVTSAVPDGFDVQRVGTLPSGLVYLREVEGTWVPSDGGIFIDAPFESRFGPPVDVEEHFGKILDAVSGSTRVELDGRPAVVFESIFEQWSTPLIWILGSDGHGGIFEMGTTGLSREEAVAVAAGVRRVSLAEYMDLGSEITWDLSFGVFTDGADYEVPDLVTELATAVDVAVGIETLIPRLAYADQGETVVTTETGEVVESDGEPVRSRSVDLFIEAPSDGVEEILRAYPHSELSPQLHEERVDAYVENLRGRILSEEPYVMQAAPGPEPQFDVSRLGAEFLIEPATSADVVPETIFEGLSTDIPTATEDRPLFVLGSVREPGSDRQDVVALVWFTENDVICEGASEGSGMGSGCGFEIQVRFGYFGGYSQEGGGDDRYHVPLDTSVVQIVTPSQDYWQRPIGGWVVLPYGDTVERPTRIVAFDAQGGELGTWDTQSG